MVYQQQSWLEKKCTIPDDTYFFFNLSFHCINNVSHNGLTSQRLAFLRFIQTFGCCNKVVPLSKTKRERTQITYYCACMFCPSVCNWQTQVTPLLLLTRVRNVRFGLSCDECISLEMHPMVVFQYIEAHFKPVIYIHKTVEHVHFVIIVSMSK